MEKAKKRSCRILVRKSELMRLLGISGYGWINNIKMDLGETGLVGMD
jgi:hypothetical protein